MHDYCARLVLVNNYFQGLLSCRHAMRATICLYWALYFAWQEQSPT